MGNYYSCHLGKDRRNNDVIVHFNPRTGFTIPQHGVGKTGCEDCKTLFPELVTARTGVKLN